MNGIKNYLHVISMSIHFQDEDLFLSVPGKAAYRSSGTAGAGPELSGSGLHPEREH